MNYNSSSRIETQFRWYQIYDLVLMESADFCLMAFTGTWTDNWHWLTLGLVASCLNQSYGMVDPWNSRGSLPHTLRMWPGISPHPRSPIYLQFGMPHYTCSSVHRCIAEYNSLMPGGSLREVTISFTCRVQLSSWISGCPPQEGVFLKRTGGGGGAP